MIHDSYPAAFMPANDVESERIASDDMVARELRTLFGEEEHGSLSLPLGKW